MGTALVTGASSGIGKELSKLFAQNGHDLVLVARRADELEALAHLLEVEENHRIKAHVAPCDLSDAMARTRLIERIRSEGIQIDFVVNNAGFGSNGPFVELPPSGELGQVRLNIEALTELTRAFLPPMVERGFGRVLNIASTAGFQPGPYMSVYYATKAYVIHFSEAVAYELKGTGVTVTAHCPGATETGFASRAGNGNSLLFASGVATSQEVAEHAYRAMHRGRALAIHGPLNTLGAFLVRFSPRSTVRWLAARLNQPAARRD